jgi:hypothetical protein
MEAILREVGKKKGNSGSFSFSLLFPVPYPLFGRRRNEVTSLQTAG